MSNPFEDYVNSIDVKMPVEARITEWWASLTPDQKFQIRYMAWSMVGGIVGMLIRRFIQRYKICKK
jgi:Na+/glutamate symporter